MAKEEDELLFNRTSWKTDYFMGIMDAVHKFAKQHRVIRDEHFRFVTIITDKQDFGLGDKFKMKEFWRYLKKWLKDNKMKPFKNEDLQTFLDELASIYGEYDRKIVLAPKVNTIIAFAVMNGLVNDYNIHCSRSGHHASFNNKTNHSQSFDCGYGGAGGFFEVDNVIDIWLEDNCGLRFCDGEMAKKFYAFIAQNLHLVANEVSNDEYFS